jgi:hypothetical protein
MFDWVKRLFNNPVKHEPSTDCFQGELKYNTVFVTDKDLAKLSLRGFGARRLRPVVCHKSIAKKTEEVATPASAAPASVISVGDDSSMTLDNTADAEADSAEIHSSWPSSAPASAANTPKAKNKSKAPPASAAADTSPMILFDEEAFYLHNIGLLELQHQDGSSVTQQDLWDKFVEKNANFPLKFKGMCLSRVSLATHVMCRVSCVWHVLYHPATTPHY